MQILRTFIFQLLNNSQQCILKPVKFNDNIRKRLFCDTALDVNTNVVKDVILYKFSNDRFFKTLNIFALCQFGFWTYLSNFAYTNLRNVPIDETAAQHWYEKINLGEKKYRIGFTLISLTIGCGILFTSWMYTLRSIRYLVLRKGGKEMTIATYTPWGGTRMFTLGLEDLNCKQLRQEVKWQLPIKVKGHFFYYLLDMKGEFRNTALFDHTAGLKRTWKN